MRENDGLRQKALTCGIACGFAAFLAIVALKYAGALEGVDAAILTALRTDDPGVAIGPGWFEQAVVQFTALGGYTVMGVMAFVMAGGLAIAGQGRLAPVLPVAFVSAIGIENLLKIAFARPRPDIVGHLIETHTMSFPSGHAMVGAVVWLTLGALVAHVSPRVALRRYAIAVAVAMTFLIGASRLYLGVHWPSDVLAGWSLGIAWTALVLLVFRLREPRAVL
ncbi:phosphatase PAP2 family protein [Aliihoeflea sp. PC F10.4]